MEKEILGKLDADQLLVPFSKPQGISQWCTAVSNSDPKDIWKLGEYQSKGTKPTRQQL